MNIERMKKVLEEIKNEKNFFDMKAIWFSLGDFNANYSDEGVKQEIPACGTPACICGWANHLQFLELETPNEREIEINKEKYHDFMGSVDYENTGDWLGLTRLEAEYIFEGYWVDEILSKITREDVIEYLEKVIETGIIYWKKSTEGEWRIKDKECHD